LQIYFGLTVTSIKNTVAVFLTFAFEDNFFAAEKGVRVLKRRQARESILKALFMVDTGENDPEAVERYLLTEAGVSEEEGDFFRSFFYGVLEKKAQLDSTLKDHLINWKLDRLSPVVRNILRMGLYEVLYLPGIPEKVSLNEAIELAKIFQDEEAARFVNGVLDRARKSVKGEC